MQRKGQCCGKEGMATFQRRHEGALEVARLAANLHLADGIAGASALVKPLAEKVLGLLATPAMEPTPAQQLPVGSPSRSKAGSASGFEAGSLGSPTGSNTRTGSFDEGISDSISASGDESGS